tara:strand:+ start:1214 stop:1477 length:264 start_codon:yes stop_codon:yes gene_type:complete
MKVKKPNFDTFSDNDIITYNILKMWVNKTHYGKEDIIKILTSDFKEGKEWQHEKKRLEFIYDNYIASTPKAKENENINYLFNSLCWK